ncbi:hypothetical protein ACFQDR_18450 [Sulfitobacter sediminilitoris]
MRHSIPRIKGSIEIGLHQAHQVRFFQSVSTGDRDHGTHAVCAGVRDDDDRYVLKREFKRGATRYYIRVQRLHYTAQTRHRHRRLCCGGTSD